MTYAGIDEQQRRCAGCDVLGAGDQRERLSVVETWRHAGSHTSDGGTDAGADPRHSGGTQGCVRQPHQLREYGKMLHLVFGHVS